MLSYFSKSKKDEAAATKGDGAPTGTAVPLPVDHAVEEMAATELSNDITTVSGAKATTARPISSAGNKDKPVLSDEDELFLLHVASEGEPPPLPPRPNSLKSSNLEVQGESTSSKPAGTPQSTGHDTKTWQDKTYEWFKPQQDLALQRIHDLATATQAASLKRQRSKDRRDTADTLAHAAQTYKAASKEPSPTRTAHDEAEEEKKEVGGILERLNLGSINNRVVGVSNDTQKLLERFNQILKDIVNGVPTAYDDLEKLLTDREGQLDKLYGTLPPWIQGLVKTVPVKVYAALAPQLAAAMTAEQSKASSASADDSKDSKSKSKKKKSRIPSLKSMIGQKGMVAGMLRSIIGFLQARFPFLLAGTNIIVSLAVFILLFVFWYCHKRGRETRLEREAREAEEGDASGVEYEDSSDGEKGVGGERRSDVGANDGMPAATKQITASDDRDIEQNVDVLMEQLGKPAEKTTSV